MILTGWEFVEEVFRVASCLTTKTQNTTTTVQYPLLVLHNTTVQQQKKEEDRIEVEYLVPTSTSSVTTVFIVNRGSTSLIANFVIVTTLLSLKVPRTSKIYCIKMKNYVIIILQSFISSTNAWQVLLPSSFTTLSSRRLSNNHQCFGRINNNKYYLKTTTTENENNLIISPCYYKVGDKWKKRIRLDELRVGQKIIGERITNADLLQAKTGPKS